jgi:hypothetical protein
MKFNLIQWLFTDPCTAGGGPASGNSDCPNPEQFHFWVPWLIICVGLIVFWGYYQVEGRRRIFGNHALHKSIFDRMLNAYAVIGLVGLIVMFFRWAADSSLFAWRFWRYAWLVWLLAVTVRWGIYFIFKYKSELDSYRAYRTHQRYVPQPKSKRTARAGAR